MSYQFIRVETRDRVGLVTLDRPQQLNALNDTLIDELGTALEAFTGAVTTSLKKGQRVSLVNFGTFTISKRKARMGRNPRTGESLKIPAARVPKFSAGKELRSAVK